MTGTRILVALSGGVDSGLAAALLRERGAQVIGATLRFWLCDGENLGETQKSCCGIDGINKARGVAGALGFSHYVIDCREDFEQVVLRHSWDEYARGRTPNPCVFCNQFIKFGVLIKYAAKLGATHVATGHYARMVKNGKNFSLLRGTDRSKDQSYFLFSLEPEQLPKIMFPLGDLSKSEVRRRARVLGLPNADRGESQDACLVGPEGFAEALRGRFGQPSPSGTLIDPAGKVLGNHRGIHRFTVGQRKGLGIALGKRAYVTEIKGDSQEVVLSTEPRDLMASGVIVKKVSWHHKPDDDFFNAQVQIRYRHTAAPAVVEVLEDDTLRIRFKDPQKAITPGQAAVIYEGDKVLGGGWIDSPFLETKNKSNQEK